MRVELVKVGVEVERWETNTNEWIPRPFSPGASRMDDVMMSQLTRLTGSKNPLG